MDKQLLKVEVGTLVFLTAARVFDGLAGRYINRPRQGPFIVEKVYKSGEHWRVKAVEYNISESGHLESGLMTPRQYDCGR